MSMVQSWLFIGNEIIEAVTAPITSKVICECDLKIGIHGAKYIKMTIKRIKYVNLGIESYGGGDRR